MLVAAGLPKRLAQHGLSPAGFFSTGRFGGLLVCAARPRGTTTVMRRRFHRHARPSVGYIGSGACLCRILWTSTTRARSA